MAAARVKGKDHFPTAVRSWWVPSERLVGDGGSGGTAAVGAAASSTIAWSPIRKAAGQEAAGTAEGRTSRKGARVRSGEGGKGGRKWLVGQPSGCSGLMPPTKAKRALRTRSPPSPKSPVPSNFYGLWTWQAYPNRHAERSTSLPRVTPPRKTAWTIGRGLYEPGRPPAPPFRSGRCMYARRVGVPVDPRAWEDPSTTPGCPAAPLPLPHRPGVGLAPRRTNLGSGTDRVSARPTPPSRLPAR